MLSVSALIPCTRSSIMFLSCIILCVNLSLVCVPVASLPLTCVARLYTCQRCTWLHYRVNLFERPMSQCFFPGLFNFGFSVVSKYPLCVLCISLVLFFGVLFLFPVRVFVCTLLPLFFSCFLVFTFLSLLYSLLFPPGCS